METAAISYRVVDFLKQYPPFQAMEERDLLDLAQRGRVRFFEGNEYILWQGASRLQVLVIQQGTVTLWDEAGEHAALRDVRGVGDMLGIDQFNVGGLYPYSARSASDVLVYAFPENDFRSLLLKYPHAAQYVSAYGNLNTDYQPGQERRDPQNVFLHDLVAGRKVPTCEARSSIRYVAQHMLATGAEAIAIVDAEGRARALLAPRSFLEWISRGGGDVEQPVEPLAPGVPCAVASDASVTEGVLAMSTTESNALAITTDGTPAGRLHGIVTLQDLAPAFGDQPNIILSEIGRATSVSSLRDLNRRARAFALQHLTGATSSDWVARFTSLIDDGIARRIIAMEDPDESGACWCFYGAAGRGESLTALAPQVLAIADDGARQAGAAKTFLRVVDLLGECGYLSSVEGPFEPTFYAADISQWRKRFQDWVRDPIFKGMYQARPVFDLRPIHGRRSLWHEIEAGVASSVNRDFLHVLANDCLSSLPPLTFFEDAVVEESGEHTAVFRLEHSALRPLVDVGRVFGMAAGKVLGGSTLERFALARTLLPENESIFREASETLRIVLWQQGRVGISQGTAGADLPPSLLSRYDRQVLRTGFRSILRLLEFTAERQWLRRL
jgi:CBS domain-containing protein